MCKTYFLKEISEENLSMVGYKHKGEFSIEKLLNVEVIREMGFEYGIVYNYDSVISNKIEKIRIDIENIIEARFFNESSEIRIFYDDGVFSGSIFIEKEKCDPIVQKMFLYPRYGEITGYAEKLVIKKYIDYDEDDSQAFIAYVKPSKLIIKE